MFVHVRSIVQALTIKCFFFVLSLLFLLRLDGWLSAAADCLELFPDQLIMVAGEQLSQRNGNAEQMASQKRLLFDTIGKYYSGQERSPLIPGRYLDVHVACLNLLGKAWWNKTILHT